MEEDILLENENENDDNSEVCEETNEEIECEDTADETPIESDNVTEEVVSNESDNE